MMLCLPLPYRKPKSLALELTTFSVIVVKDNIAGLLIVNSCTIYELCTLIPRMMSQILFFEFSATTSFFDGDLEYN